jgi:methyl-accepting chemotaxis protein
LEPLLTLFVGLTALAVLMQAGILLSIYLLSRRVAEQVEASAAEFRELTPSLKIVTGNLMKVSEDAVEIGNAARQQIERVDSLIGEVGHTVEGQLEKVDRLSREVSDRVNETVTIVQDSIVRPVREVGALARGVTRGVEVLLNRKNRSTVDQAHSDEELFI